MEGLKLKMENLFEGVKVLGELNDVQFIYIAIEFKL